MPVYPHTRLHIGPTSSVVISGPYVQVVNNQTGEVEAIADELYVLKSGPIRCSAVDPKWELLVTSADDKRMKLWSVRMGLMPVGERELPKKPTDVRITQDSETILVSDKFGDVFRYPMFPTPDDEIAAITNERPNAKKGALASHENLAGGTLVLGHASLLTSFILSRDEKYIITADRDEHIRVSWYPQGHVVERYCLGHTKFVSAIHIPAFSKHSLISGGGDSDIRCWDWITGLTGTIIPVFETVRPFIKVRPAKGRSWSNDGEDENGDGVSNEKSGRKKGKGRRKRGKDQAQVKGDQEPQDGEAGGEGGAEAEVGVEEGELEGEGVEKETTDDVPMAENTSDGDVAGEPRPATQEQEADQDPPVLVINRIETMTRTDGSHWIFFNAVGATALFYIRHPIDWSPLAPEHPAPLSLDLGKPIIDFLIADDGKIWVLTDGEWVNPSTTTTTTAEEGQAEHKGARLVGWSNGETGWHLEELTDSPPLLVALNSTCLKPATPAELKILDLYGHLSSIPKNVDAEHDPMVRDDLTELAASLDGPSFASSSGKGGRKGKVGRKGKGDGQLTQRELARLKNKKALIASMQGKERGKSESVAPESGGSGSGKKVDGEGEVKERESKKVKADTDGHGKEQSVEETDAVGMDES